jgi:hypothetical protein
VSDGEARGLSLRAVDSRVHEREDGLVDNREE